MEAKFHNTTIPPYNKFNTPVYPYKSAIFYVNKITKIITINLTHSSTSSFITIR